MLACVFAKLIVSRKIENFQIFGEPLWQSFKNSNWHDSWLFLPKFSASIYKSWCFVTFLNLFFDNLIFSRYATSIKRQLKKKKNSRAWCVVFRVNLSLYLKTPEMLTSSFSNYFFWRELPVVFFPNNKANFLHVFQYLTQYCYCYY